MARRIAGEFTFRSAIRLATAPLLALLAAAVLLASADAARAETGQDSQALVVEGLCFLPDGVCVSGRLRESCQVDDDCDVIRIGCYEFEDASTDPDDPDFDQDLFDQGRFTDISGTGIRLEIGGDQVSSPIPLHGRLRDPDETPSAIPPRIPDPPPSSNPNTEIVPFNFTFYQDTYQSVRVSSDGWLSFQPTTSDPTADPIPGRLVVPFSPDDSSQGVPGGLTVRDFGPPDALVAGLWKDLDPSVDAGMIHYQTLGQSPNRRFIVQFTRVSENKTSPPRDPAGYPSTWQVILVEGSDEVFVSYIEAHSGSQNAEPDIRCEFVEALEEKACVSGDHVGMVGLCEVDEDCQRFGTTAGIENEFTASVGGSPPVSGSTCLFEHNGPGCNNTACQNAVCGETSRCCQSGNDWDSACVDDAFRLCTESGDIGLEYRSTSWDADGPFWLVHRIVRYKKLGFGDSDNDGTIDCLDNCPSNSNRNQQDSDNDFLGDACDNCPQVFNPDQANITESRAHETTPVPAIPDFIGDVCDNSDNDQFTDADPLTQGVDDNCPLEANPLQLDIDDDDFGDICDQCFGAGQLDVDLDAACEGPVRGSDDVLSGADNCPPVLCEELGFLDPIVGCSNPDQLDFDDDGVGDVCDEFPSDPDNDADGDGDGVIDTDCAEYAIEGVLCECSVGLVGEECQADAHCNVGKEGICSNVDSTGFGVCSRGKWGRECQINDDCDDFEVLGVCDDDCRSVPGNTVCIACAPGATLVDGECVPENGRMNDPWPLDPNNDEDDDGVPVQIVLHGACDHGLSRCVMGQVGDDCDTDFDCFIRDNCPDVPNNQDDLDRDGFGNLCDNCTSNYNPDQADIDNDGFVQWGVPCIGEDCGGDRCDDSEGDGVLDYLDRCPFDELSSDPTNEPEAGTFDGRDMDGRCRIGVFDGAGVDAEDWGFTPTADVCPDDPTDDDLDQGGDGDGHCENLDNCPMFICQQTGQPLNRCVNPDQENTAAIRGSTIGDACNDPFDEDGDEWEDGGQEVCDPNGKLGCRTPGQTDNCAPVDCENLLKKWEEELEITDPATTDAWRGFQCGDGPCSSRNQALANGCFNPSQCNSWEDGDGTNGPGESCLLPERLAGQMPPRTPDRFGDVCDDGDDDFVVDALDNCPYNSNFDQEDTDGDGLGDLCDVCPEGSDFDSDGVCSNVDNCPDTFNPGQNDNYGTAAGDACEDTDNDGANDDVDVCPLSNPNDADNDGICDDVDACLNDPVNDPDGDNVCASVPDNCQDTMNPDQADTDGDGKGDACDVCPNDNPDDPDGDLFCESVDNCPGVPNAGQEDNYGTAAGDACEDTDGDGVVDAQDICPVDNPNDPDGDLICTAQDPWPKDRDNDLDADGIPDNFDASAPTDACPRDPMNDEDGDGVCGDVDNCPTVSNTDQRDTNNNGVGDLCEDNDVDGVLGAADNCLDDSNPEQGDVDSDGIGDVCDDSNSPDADDLASCDEGSLLLTGTDKVKAGKSKDEIGWRYFCLEPEGTWVGVDDDNDVWRGSYAPKGNKGGKWTASFDGPSIIQLSQAIPERLGGSAAQSATFKKLPDMKIRVKTTKGKIKSRAKFQIGSQKGNQKVKLSYVP